MSNGRRLERATSQVGGATITLHNVSYTVQAKHPTKNFGTVEKQILRNIEGVFKPGMNALMGPTGSGKSSLLDVVAGRKNPQGLSGTLLVDGMPQPKNFKCMTGYVVQDDIVTGTLTVRENLMFSANLRIPTSVPTEVKKAKVEETIRELGLEKCADTKIGTEFIRGVSGGERKRTNIGMELVIGPPVLFLDEPTTGLDANTSNSVLRLLQRLSRKGRTIIFSIHQPRFSIFNTFDHLLLLCEGRTVFHGEAQAAESFFESLGYFCEEHNNPPDFFLDVMLGDIKAVEKPRLEAEEYGQTVKHGDMEMTSFGGRASICETKNGSGRSSIPSVKVVPEVQQVDVELGKSSNQNAYEARQTQAIGLAESYKKSKWYSDIKDEIEPVYKEYQKHLALGTAKQIMVGDYATGFFSQTGTVSSRALKVLVRDPQTILMQTLLSLTMALIGGIIFLQLESDFVSGIQNRTGALFFVALNMVFTTFASIITFIGERAIFMHERVSGFYRVSSYFISKVLFDIIPLRLFPTTMYCIISYFMMGLQTDVAKFFQFYLTNLLMTFAATAITFFASCATRQLLVANLIAVLICVVSMVFGGFLVNLDAMGSWLSWLQYLSVVRYGLNALLIIELKDQEYCSIINPDDTPFPPGLLPNITVCNSGNEHLREQGISYASDWDFWQNNVGLAGLMSFFLLVSLGILMNMKKYKD